VKDQSSSDANAAVVALAASFMTERVSPEDSFHLLKMRQRSDANKTKRREPKACALRWDIALIGREGAYLSKAAQAWLALLREFPVNRAVQ
jgi:hypothetical protein